MKRSYLILSCLMLWAVAATAQIDSHDNGIGIYAKNFHHAVNDFDKSAVFIFCSHVSPLLLFKN